jgi:hypothetical protein
MGGFLTRTLAFHIVGAVYIQQGFFAPRALPRFVATVSPSETLSSSTDFLAFPVIRLSCSVRFLGQDEEGFSSRFRMSLPSCCRYYPARVARRSSQICDGPCCLRPTVGGSTSGASHFRGHFCVHFRYGPMARSPPLKMASSIGFRNEVSLLSCYSSYEAPDYYLGEFNKSH